MMKEKDEDDDDEDDEDEEDEDEEDEDEELTMKDELGREERKARNMNIEGEIRLCNRLQ
jgi:hypothetical protein